MKIVIIAAMCFSMPAAAQEAGVFGKFLTPESPQCIPVADISKVGKVIKLNNNQFQFLRGLYTALPPASKSLPPGERAILAGAEDRSVMAALVTGDAKGDEACARFLVPDFVLDMINKVGKGEDTKLGDPT